MNTKFTQQIINQVESAFNTCLASNTMSGQIAAKRAIELLQETLEAEQSAEQYEKGWLKLDAEKQQESEYITAKQAKALGYCKAEFQLRDGTWELCEPLSAWEFPYLERFIDTDEPIKYRAIKQALPEPVDPHAALRAEYAKQVADGTVGFYLWEFNDDSSGYQLCETILGKSVEPLFFPDSKYRCTDISCYVAKQGEPAKRMLRTEAQELQRSLGDTVEWYLGATNMSNWKELDFNGTGTYTYAPKALKIVKWSDMPVGVAVLNQHNDIFTIVGHIGAKVTMVGVSKSIAYEWSCKDLRLAPASEQKYIVGDASQIDKMEKLGLKFSWRDCDNRMGDGIIIFKITGIAKGYVLEGAV